MVDGDQSNVVQPEVPNEPVPTTFNSNTMEVNNVWNIQISPHGSLAHPSPVFIPRGTLLGRRDLEQGLRGNAVTELGELTPLQRVSTWPWHRGVG